MAQGQSAVYYDETIKPKGLPTGSWVRVLETAGQHNAITSYSLYDNKARPVRTKSTNPANGYTQVDNKYNFIGNPLQTITKNKKNAAARVLVITDDFTYTDQSRPLKHTHKIGNGTPQLLASNHYDALGRLEYKKVGGIATTPLQKVDYSYNARGWLTDINNVANLAQSGDPQDLFAFKIHYATVDDDINGTVAPLYNGNIAETFWRTSSDNIKRKYGYSYDYGNRLLDAYYQLPGTAVPRADSYSTHYSYDRNGNILSLQRSGEQDIANAVVDIDDLVYTYDNGNQLTNVHDGEQSSAGYNDQHPAVGTPDFSYDSYGNLISDEDKDITSVEYNHLNLPTKVIFGTGDKIEYFYDATGVKLKKKVTNGSTITTTDYMDGFQYTNGYLDFFPTAEGYVKVLYSSISSAYKYVFNYVDHLGNIRLSYAQDPRNNNELAILEENHYYPYGLKHNGYNSNHSVIEITTSGVVTLTPVNPFLGDTYKYKFGGKEYDDTFNINTYDFGARNYDPALGRWLNMDNHAESYMSWTPYNFAYNSPLMVVDPDGQDGIFINEDGKEIGNDGIDDGKVYVVKTTSTTADLDSGVSANGITKSEAKATEKFIKQNSGDTSAFQDNSIAYDNSVEIEGSQATRQSMVDIVEQDNGRGGTGDANNREYGGVISNEGTVTQSPAGDVVSPKTSPVASIEHTTGGNTKGTFHSHPSGTIVEGQNTNSNTIQMSGTVTTYGFANAPSNGAGYDVNSSRSSGTTNYTFARKNGKVYIYNSKSGVQATLPHKRFVNFKQ